MIRRIGYWRLFSLFITFICATAICNSEAASSGQHQLVTNGVSSMRVLWRVSDYRISDAAKLSEDMAKQMLFKPLDMDENSITFDGTTCGDVTFATESVAAKSYIEKTYDITVQHLGIDYEIVRVTRTDCSIPGFKQFIRLPDRRLIIWVEGVFFFFEPAVVY